MSAYTDAVAAERAREIELQAYRQRLIAADSDPTNYSLDYTEREGVDSNNDGLVWYTDKAQFVGSPTYPTFIWDIYTPTEATAINCPANSVYAAVPVSQTTNVVRNVPDGWSTPSSGAYEDYLIVPAGLYSITWVWDSADAYLGDTWHIEGAVGPVHPTMPDPANPVAHYLYPSRTLRNTGFLGTTVKVTPLDEDTWIAPAGSCGMWFGSCNDHNVAHPIWHQIVVVRLDS